MMMTSAREQEFKTSTPNPRFDVTPPSTNPLVPSLPIVVTKVRGAVEVSWHQESSISEHKIAGEVLEQLSSQAKKDTLRFPQSARAHANLGVALANAGRLEEASSELDTALALDPADYLAGVTLGRVYVSQGKYDRAKILYEELLKRYARSDSILLSLAYLSLKENDYGAAEKYLNRVLSLRRNVAFPHFLLGVTRLQRGNVHGAISALREAARIDVRTAALHHTLGVAYVMAGDLGRAERAFRMALALSPDTEHILYALCEVLLGQKRAAVALDIVRQRVDAHPTDAAARELLARTYIELGKHSQARAQLQAVLQMAGENMLGTERARFITNIAATLLHEGKNSSAESELRRAIDLAPRSSSVPYEILARLYVQLGQFESATEVLAQARKLFPDRQTVQRFLSGVYTRLDRYDLAIAEVRPLWEQGRAEAETLCLLGSLYEWVTDYETALRALREAYDLSPKDPSIINNLAYTYLMTGQVEEARRILGSLPRSVEPHAELVATQGLLRLWEGHREGGRLLYDKAERMASEAGNRNLAKRVRQKMHLELAKDSLRRGDFVTAQTEIKRGLSIRPGGNSFEVKLEQLLSSLKTLERG